MATVENAVVEQPLALRAKTLCEAFLRTASERPDQVALRTPRDGVTITWGEYRDRVERIAAGLAALGVERGDTVGIMLLNRPEFNIVDAAAMHLGATPFSIYNTSSPEQVAYLFGNAGNRVVITERQFLPTIEAADVQGIKDVVVIDDGLGELEAGGDPSFDFDAAWRAVEPDDLITL